jgi:hypothetical protein
MSSPAPPRRLHLAVIEPVTDVGDRPVMGWMVLTRLDNFFELIWSPLDDTPIKHVTAIFQPLDIPAGEWLAGKFLKSDCRNISSVSLSADGDDIVIVVRRPGPPERRFRVSQQNFLQVSRFVEQLIFHGIAVPCRTDTDPYSLKFYSRASRSVFVSVPPYIQLEYKGFTSFDAFWDLVHNFLRELIIHLDDSNTLPRDPQFPLADAACAAHYLVMERIGAWTAELPSHQPITATEWPSLFDDLGSLRDPALFFERVFAAGVEKSAMTNALPFVFGVFSPDSTAADREAIEHKLEGQFKGLVEQVKTVKQHQLDHHKKLASSFRVIMHDVGRTDRWHEAFKQQNGPGLEMLTVLLRAYCLYNPTIGYLQGMNDLFVPIILAYFPLWNEEGQPVNDARQVVDYEAKIPIIFWCFEGLLQKTNHLVLLSSVTEQCQEKARVIARLILSVSPLVAIWMKRNGLADLLWLYSDFVLLFKRSFDDVWPIWFQFCCAPASTNWLTYFITAILLQTFHEFSTLPEISITTIMDAFGNRLLKNIKPDVTGKIALWHCKNFPIESPAPPSNTNADAHFEFFEIDDTA